MAAHDFTNTPPKDTSTWQIQTGLFRHGASMDKSPRKGRNPFEGYVRGCGLIDGNLGQLCAQDRDFQQALHLSRGRSVVPDVKLMNIFVLFKLFLPKIARGHIAEFGSFKGGSALFMAFLAQRYLGNMRVYAFDTYEGMPPVDPHVDAHMTGDFAQTSAEEIRQVAATAGLHNLICVKGRFEDTALPTLREAGSLALVHIDCDIYSAVAYAYDAVKEFMVPGGYIVLDDPLESACLGGAGSSGRAHGLSRRPSCRTGQAAPCIPVSKNLIWV